MLEIVTLEVTPLFQNARLLLCSVTKDLVVVDPGGDSGRILEAAAKLGASISQIWLTHSHLDHCGGVASLRQSAKIKLLGHADEIDLRENVELISEMYGIPKGLMQDCPEPETYLYGGEELFCGEQKFEVLFTPGHSPGHLCFYCPEAAVLIAGDTLFAGSVGRTDLPGGDQGLLMSSIRDKILCLPDNTRVLSGHGPDTTVGRERSTNPFLVR